MLSLEEIGTILNYDAPPKLEYTDVPLSGKEARRIRRKQELRKERIDYVNKRTDR